MAVAPDSLLARLSQLGDALRSLHKGGAQPPWAPLAGLALLSATVLWSFTASTLGGVDPAPRPLLGLLPAHQLLSADIQKLHWIEKETPEVSREIQRLRAQLAQMGTGLQGPQGGGAEEGSGKAEEEREKRVKDVRKALRGAEDKLQGMGREKGEIEARLRAVLNAASQGAGDQAGEGQPQGGQEGQEGQEQAQEQGQGNKEGESGAQEASGQSGAAEGDSEDGDKPASPAASAPESNADSSRSSSNTAIASTSQAAAPESTEAEGSHASKQEETREEEAAHPKQESPLPAVAPAEPAHPAPEAAASQPQNPATEESSAKQDSPATEDAAAEQETPAAQEGTPKQEPTTNQQGSPKPESPAADDEWPPISLKTLQEHTQPLSDWPGVTPLMDLSSLQPASASGTPGPESASSSALTGGAGGAEGSAAAGMPRFYALEAWPDRCAGVAHKRYALKCALGEARALGRALALHKTTCISPDHTQLPYNLWTATAAYFDLEELAASQPVPIVYIEDLVSAMAAQEAASKPPSASAASNSSDSSIGRDGAGLFRVREFNLSVPSAILAADNASDLLLRHLRYMENGFQVCDLDENKHLWPISPDIPFNRHLVHIAKMILEELGANFTAVHIRRGDKARRTDRWPHLGNDTSAESLREKLPRFAPLGSTLYLATNEEEPHFFDPLRDLFRVLRLADFGRLWGPGSEWHREMQTLLGTQDPKLDLYMTGIVDDYIMGHGTRRVETFNDLTSDPRNGVPSQEGGDKH